MPETVTVSPTVVVSERHCQELLWDALEHYRKSFIHDDEASGLLDNMIHDVRLQMPALYHP